MRHYSCRMPSADSQRLRALEGALLGVRDVSRVGTEEVLDAFPEVGEREAQAAVESLVEHAVDALRALDAAAGETAGRVAVAVRTASRAASTAGGVGAGSAAGGVGAPPAESRPDPASW